MNKIPSFTVDHTRLLRGVYLSRRDVTPSGDTLTTFDIRLTEPNRQPPLTPAVLHTIEHLAATYLRNHPEWGPRIVYWGPMGCLTGSYLIVQGELQSTQILPLLRQCFSFIAQYTGPIPGASPRDCGNYTLMDLPAARQCARTFLDQILDHPSQANLTYPQ